MFIITRSVSESRPGPKWLKRFEKNWPFYRKWFLSEGINERPGYLTSARKLEEHMPELYPVYQELCELVGGGDVEARFLSHWSPPPYMSGCSQIAWNRESPSLIRNYDYGIEFFEGLIFRSEWLKPVIGMSDSCWGLLDGINADGLVASLTFGGRKISGEGMGIPLIIRYILETCSTVEEAIEVLKRIPVHMTYNVTLIDRSGTFNTVYLSPDRPTEVTPWAVGTNHQHEVEWPDYARITKTVERKEILDAAWLNPQENRESLIRKFLSPPLFNTNFKKRFGTLYTALYDTKEGSIDLYWQNFHLHQSFEHFSERKDMVHVTNTVGQKITY